MIKQSALDGFYGDDTQYRWSPLFPNVVLSEGAQYVAENGGGSGAFWLMDAIASYQSELRGEYPWAREMQFWNLTVMPSGGGVLTCTEDSGIEPVVRQEFTYTDFDLLSIDLWVGPSPAGGMLIFLPSEY